MYTFGSSLTLGAKPVGRKLIAEGIDGGSLTPAEAVE